MQQQVFTSKLMTLSEMGNLLDWAIGCEKIYGKTETFIDYLNWSKGVPHAR